MVASHRRARHYFRSLGSAGGKVAAIYGPGIMYFREFQWKVIDLISRWLIHNSLSYTYGAMVLASSMKWQIEKRLSVLV